MKLSLQLAQSVAGVDITSGGVADIVKKIGAQLGAIEDVINWSDRYDRIVVVRVVSCQKHANADKLNVCLVDDGGVTDGVERTADRYVQVVCGAPNVREGLMVAWIPPGGTVPVTTNDSQPFVLGTRELRGVVSNGMLASPSELGISDDHDGILEITENTNPGQPFKTLYKLDDTVIDLENKMFTHRPDCFGTIGVARELAGIQHISFTSPDWYSKEPQFRDTNLDNLILDISSDLVPRFSAIVADNVTVSSSPTWLQADLSKWGIRPINNVVDITNWVMYMTGQPLHAYDYDKVKAIGNSSTVKIGARLSKKGDELTLLNGKTIHFEDTSTILICTDDTPIGVGGIMGGADTEVDGTTKRIILEAATFDMYAIRKSAMKYGLFTDAVTRFNKGQSPLQTTRALAKALEMVQQLTGGKQASVLSDYKTDVVVPLPDIAVETSFVNDRLGTTLDAQQMAQLLNNVECPVSIQKTQLIVTVPFWRRDLHIPEDIVEEIGRLYGYDSVPKLLPARSASATERNAFVDFKYKLRDIVTAAGANELLTYSFVHKKILENSGQNVNNAYALSNALSPDLQYYRLSLTPSLLDKVHQNIKAGYGSFATYEIGKSHSKLYIDSDALPIENEQCALVFAADAKEAKKYQGEAYYQARTYLETLACKLHIRLVFQSLKDADASLQNSDIVQPYYAERCAIVTTHDGLLIGVIGEYSAQAAKYFKLPQFCAGFELNISNLFTAYKQTASVYRQLSKYPKVTQDITLQTPVRTSFSAIQRALNDVLQKLQPEDVVCDVTPLDIYSSEDTTRYTFRVQCVSYANTLRAADINSLLDSVAEQLQQTTGAVRI